METRNSSAVPGDPRRAAIEATEGETPGIQATSDPPRPPDSTALAMVGPGILILLSVCLGIWTFVVRLRIRDEAPKIPDRRGRRTCGSRSSGEYSRSSCSKANMPRTPLVRKSIPAINLYFQ